MPYLDPLSGKPLNGFSYQLEEPFVSLFGNVVSQNGKGFLTPLGTFNRLTEQAGLLTAITDTRVE